MIEGRQNVLAWFENTGFTYWLIYPGKNTDGGNWTAKSGESESQTPGDSLRELQRTMQLLSGGSFTIVASQVPKNVAKGAYKVEFRISVFDSQPQPAAQAPAVAGIGADEIQQRIADGIAKAMTEHRLKLLEAENAALKKELAEHDTNDPWHRVGTIVADYGPQLIPLLTGTATQPMAKVAGLQAQPAQVIQTTEPTTDENNEVDPAAQEKLERVISIFSEIDPEGWLDKLEQLALKLQAKPSLLNMINLL
jgi:hypothetical protein